MKAWLFSLLLLFALPALSDEAKGQLLEYSAFPDRSNNFAEASFSCRLPKHPALGILFLAGGTDCDARPWLLDPRWQALADSERLVLIAACLRGAGEAYEVASKGSGQALLDAIDTFARKSGRPDLSSLPVTLYGHSAGAQFVFNFACWKPERVRAIICLKSGPLAQPSFSSPPSFRALFIVGEHDTNGRVREVARAFHLGRSARAPWSLAVQPDAGHGAEGCSAIVDAFVKTTSTRASEATFASLSEPLERRDLAKAAADPSYSWLPNAQFAKLWQSFVKGASLNALMHLPEDSPEMNLSWHPITALLNRVDMESPRIPFEYAVSLPADAGEIKDANVTFASPEIIASAARHPGRGWTVSGTCDLRHKPASPFRGRIEIEVLTSTSARMHGDLSLYCRVSGPVSASPPSLYYGVVPRESSRTFTVSLRATSAHSIRSCKAISSDPELVDVSLSKAPTGGVYEAKCIINAGTRIGERSGTITFRVETDREHLITVPYYGFIKK